MTSTQPYSGTDFYCDVALPDPDSLDVVHEDERVLVYHHTRPFWAVHLVAVPKRHIPSLTDTCGATDEDLCALFDAVQTVARRVELEHGAARSEEHTSELQSRGHLVCRLLLEKKKHT